MSAKSETNTQRNPMADDQNEDVTPLRQPQPDPMGGDRMMAGLAEYLAGKIPTKLLPPEHREPACMEFVEMLGRLIEFMEGFKPLTTPKMAALLYFYQQLDLQSLDEDRAFVIMTIVDAAKNTARKMRRESKEGA
jgi:hypothetical protein